MNVIFIILTSCLLSTTSPLAAAAESSKTSNGVSYAVVVDAGSSGSRAYLYTWPEHSGDPHELLNISPLMNEKGFPLYKKVAPGLSSLQDTPKSALNYIRPLLEFASLHIPASKIRETPLYILATAGMRMVETSKREALMAELRSAINHNYGFLFPEGNLEVITGKQEGIYQWLAINYVLGKFTEHSDTNSQAGGQDPKMVVMPDEPAVFRPRTVGAIDMGGASMQIAMEITSELQLEGLTDHEKLQVAEINLGCKDHDTEHTYRIFVTTFLGFGANEALARHRRDLILSQIQPEDAKVELKGLDLSNRLEDPCLAAGFLDNVTMPVEVDLFNINEPYRKQLSNPDSMLYLVGTGAWTECVNSLKYFTKSREKFTKCASKAPSAITASSCPDSGIKVPSIQFENSEFYGFSEFWYSMEDVLGMGGPYIHSSYASAAADFCKTPWPVSWHKFTQGQYPKADQARLETQCFKSAWLTVALHQGFDFPDDYTHMSAAPEAVNGKVVHWTLGALLYRTRFLPLRAIESHSRDQFHYGVYHSAFASGYLYSHYIVFLCLVLVIVAIVVYIQRLKRYVKPSTLRRIPSMLLPQRSPTNSPINSYPATPEEDDRLLLLGGVETSEPRDFSNHIHQSKSVASFFHV